MSTLSGMRPLKAVLPVALAALLRGVPRERASVPAVPLVAPHEPVDGLVRHARAALQPHAPGDLLRAPVLFELLHDVRPDGLREPDASATIGMPIVAEALRLLRAIPAKPRVPLQLPGHRRRGTAERPRDLRLAVVRLETRVEVISLVLGRAGVTLCHGNTPLF